MKQLLKRSLLIALSLLLVLCLVGCDSTTTRKKDRDDDDSDSSEETDESLEVTIDETVLYSDEIATITAKSLNHDSSYSSTTLTMSIVNHSTNNITVSLDGCAINQITIDSAYLYENVNAGKTVNTTVSFYDLASYNIEAIKDFAFVFRCYDQESYDTYFTTSPITLSTIGAESYRQTYIKGNTLVLEESGIKTYYQQYEFLEDDPEYTYDGGLEFSFYVDSTVNDLLSLTIDDLCINDCMVDYYSYTAIMPRSVAFVTVSVSQSELELNDITSVDSLELSLRFTDSNYSTVAESGTLRLTFSDM